MSDFHGLTAIVTGGASGIGAATARVLTERGAIVAILDRAHDGASGLLEITADGRGIDQAELRSARSLGLLGMKERARRLGGDVVIAGTPGRGTSVTLSVPWAQALGEESA